MLVVTFYVEETVPLRLRDERKDEKASLTRGAFLGGPRSTRSGFREIATSGMQFRIVLACLVITTSNPFWHTSYEDGGEKSVVLHFTGFHGYMSKLDFLISSNIPRSLV